MDEAARHRASGCGFHLGFAALFVVLTVVFRWIDDPSMIGLILKIAAYTYGPLFRPIRLSACFRAAEPEAP